MTQVSRSLSAICAAAVATAAMFTVPALAEPGDLSGAWSGSGAVIYNTGAKEKARCRATFSHSGGTAYSMSATCATASGKVVQSASLRKVGGNSYSGRFKNPEYNVEGTIRVTVGGNSLSVSTTGDGASASLSMHRL